MSDRTQIRPSALLSPLKLRGVELPNRIGVSPMCQHSAVNGYATDWHLVHLGARAAGGAGLVMTEATAVVPDGRISPGDLGIWDDDHVVPLARTASFIESHGAVPGIQLSHAGRKGSRQRPCEWREGVDPGGGWPIVGPSPVPFAPGWKVPRPLEIPELDALVELFAAAARRASRAGFRWLEIHAAHGYLLHSFHSPLVNTRKDPFGGSLSNRIRFTLAVAEAVRASWPDELPLAVRVSSTDWMSGGCTVAETVKLARELTDRGVDLVDCSSGGAVANAKIPIEPGYQVQFARRVREEVTVPTAAVGLITEPAEAERIIAEGSADVVLLARQMLREPYFALRAMAELGGEASGRAPVRYQRAFLA